MWNCNPVYSFGNGGWFFGPGIIGLLFNLLLAAGLLYIIVLAFRALFFRKEPNSDRSDSLEILKSKFAGGEISEQEYVRMKEILTK